MNYGLAVAIATESESKMETETGLESFALAVVSSTSAKVELSWKFARPAH